MKKTERQMWVCPLCNSIHVQQMAWVNLNESTIDWNSSEDLCDFYCNDCEEKPKSLDLRVIKTVNGAVKVQGYQVENAKQEMHPDMDASFCLYSLEQATEMIGSDGQWELKAYYKGDVEEPTLMFEGKDPRK